MAYFLKKTNNKKGTYLQIYESYYDPARKSGAHRSYKPIGYIHELQAGGIDDPITFFNAAICSGAVPQQPPRMDAPFVRQSLTIEAL